MDINTDEPYPFNNTGYQTILVFLLPSPTADVTVVAIIADHLISFIRYMRRHSNQPFEAIKGLLLPAVF